MGTKTKITLSKAQNGYVMGDVDYCGNFSNPLIFNSFEEAIASLAKDFGEEEFAQTIVQSQAMTRALTGLCSAAVAPKLAAIEAQVNPGAGNVIGLSDDI